MRHGAAAVLQLTPHPSRCPRSEAKEADPFRKRRDCPERKERLQCQLSCSGSLFQRALEHIVAYERQHCRAKVRTSGDKKINAPFRHLKPPGGRLAPSPMDFQCEKCHVEQISVPAFHRSHVPYVQCVAACRAFSLRSAFRKTFWVVFASDSPSQKSTFGCLCPSIYALFDGCKREMVGFQHDVCFFPSSPFAAVEINWKMRSDRRKKR